MTAKQTQAVTQAATQPVPIEARGLTRSYGGTTVVDDMTFTVAPGRVPRRLTAARRGSPVRRWAGRTGAAGV